MSYDKQNGLRRYAYYTTFDFGTGGATELMWIKGPKGKNGLLVDYGVEQSIEAFTATTTVPSVSVGTEADADAYGDEFSLNGLVINSFSSVRADADERTTGFTTMMDDRTIPKDTTVVVYGNPGTGTPTGQAVPFVEILWDD